MRGQIVSHENWLPLAAVPIFAIMALLTGLLADSPDMVCGATQAAWPLSGMVPMYLLMSAFHLTPWLNLISSRRRDRHTGATEESGSNDGSRGRRECSH